MYLALSFHVLEEEVAHSFLLGVEVDSADGDFLCVVFVLGCAEHGVGVCQSTGKKVL